MDGSLALSPNLRVESHFPSFSGLVIAHDVTYAFGSQKYNPGYSSASWRPSLFLCNLFAVSHTPMDGLFVFKYIVDGSLAHCPNLRVESHFPSFSLPPVPFKGASPSAFLLLFRTFKTFLPFSILCRRRPWYCIVLCVSVPARSSFVSSFSSLCPVLCYCFIRSSCALLRYCALLPVVMIDAAHPMR
jgi:hypothetical protein